MSAGSASIPPTPGPRIAPRDQEAVNSGVRVTPATRRAGVDEDEKRRGKAGGMEKVGFSGRVELSSHRNIMERWPLKISLTFHGCMEGAGWGWDKAKL